MERRMNQVEQRISGSELGDDCRGNHSSRVIPPRSHESVVGVDAIPEKAASALRARTSRDKARVGTRALFIFL
jgi:hypothetical protein